MRLKLPIWGTYIMLGFLLSLMGCSNSKKQSASNQFIQDQSLDELIASQTKMTPQTLSTLREYGVEDTDAIKLEFFFYTNEETKAVALSEVLKKLNYSVETDVSASSTDLQVITGWTTPIQMDDASVIRWTEKMCRMGFEYDCEFDGWGTNPNQ